MGIFSIAIIVIYCAGAIGMFAYSLLLLCGSKLAVSDVESQRYHIGLYRFHFGLFYLGISLIAAGMAYLQIAGATSSLVGVYFVLLMSYALSGSILLSRNKGLEKNPEMEAGTNQPSDSEMKKRRLKILCGYLLLPVLFLACAVAFH